MFLFKNLRSVCILQVSVRKMHSDDLKSIFMAGVTSVEPTTLLRRSVRIEDDTIYIKDHKYSLQNQSYVVGFGKAVLGMAIELEGILGKNLQKGIVSVPKGIFECFKDKPHLLPKSNSKIKYMEGAVNNLPDVKAYKSAIKIKQLASSLGEGDLLFVLISGGGSALLPLPIEPITLDEKLWLIKELANRGANILELNSVRKKLSQLKGGGLARAAKPAKIISLILSDIIGDPLDFIASGPTVPNFDDTEAAQNIITKYNLFNQIPQNVKNVLTSRPTYDDEIENESFTHVENFILGNNKIAAEAARTYANDAGYQSIVLSTSIQGEVDELSKIYSKLVQLIISGSNEELKLYLKDLVNKFSDISAQSENIIELDRTKKICIIGAGEPTVVVLGKGKGGRNLELALRFSVEVNNLKISTADISFLSCGTDGIDGPTDASGALGSSELVNKALVEDINPIPYLDNNDSYSFYCRYKNGQDLIKTGHTGTNVMDLHVIIIEPKVSK